jgi:hypothetical protein
MNWLSYLLEANLYLLVFYGFYFLFLRKETFYSANRYYLLGTTAISFVLPILQIGQLKPQQVIDQLTQVTSINGEFQAMNQPVAGAEAVFNLSAYVYAIYIFVAFCFAIKLFLSISKLFQIWRKAEKRRNGSVVVILIKEEAAFSFFNFLFIHPQLVDEPAILKHELVHIRQQHSVDIVFFELLQLISWFNPVAYLIQKDIKLLHEYIADELSTADGLQKHEYAMLLISNSFGVAPIPLTNQFFNQSILKSRINMLNKKRTANLARLRLLVVVPLTGAMLCTSTLAFTKEYGYLDLLPEKSKAESTSAVAPTPQEQKKAAKQQNGQHVKQDEVQFPLPKNIAQDHYFPHYFRDKKTSKVSAREPRYIVINGKPIANNAEFFGVRNTTKVLYLDSKSAVAKYGNAASKGAIEISGKEAIFLTKPVVDPPPVEKRIIKFPPPIVRPKAEVKEVVIKTVPTQKVDGLQLTEVQILNEKQAPVKINRVKGVKLGTDSLIEIRIMPTKKNNEPAVSTIEIKQKN